MALDNLFLGTARRSVGDITLFRRDGRQVARVRVRNIANPKSEAQSITRNFVAPLVRFYGALHTQLAKSFEGLSKSKSYDQFLRVNVRLARQRGWFLEKGAGFYPMPYVLSSGTLKQVQYTFSDDLAEQSVQIILDNVPGSVSTIGQLSRVFVSNGYRAGDIITFVVVVPQDNGTYAPSVQQFRVNVNDVAPLSTLNNGVFAIFYHGNGLYLYNGDVDVVAAAVLVSRFKDKRWHRSTQSLLVDDEIVAALTSAEQRAAAIKSYGPTEGSGDGDVYLDGDGVAYNVASVSGRALLFYGGQYNAKVIASGNNRFVQLKPANLDDYFYIRAADNNYLGTNSAASLSPADWRRLTVTPPSVSEDNTVLLAPDTPFYRYMQSIGYTGA